MSTEDENLFKLILSRFLPFWPLFAILIFFGLLGAWSYLKWATPIYGVSATLIIKDEKKGVDDARMMESINAFDSKKIVENEIEVIRSRGLVNKVVNDLALYAPVYEDSDLKNVSAYITSPIRVELKNPQDVPIVTEGKPTRFYISLAGDKNKIKIDNKVFSLNEWISDIRWGEIKFIPNPNQKGNPQDSLYFILVNPKKITDGILSDLEVSSTNKLSTVVSISYNDPVPKRGEDIINRLIYNYNQKAVTDRNALASSTLAFIEERMGKVGTELAELEMEIQKYRSSQGVVDLSEQGKLYLKDVGDYDREIANLNRQLDVLNRVESYVISKNNEGGLVPSTMGINDPVLSQLLEKLYNSEIEYTKLKKTTAENNPILVSIANEIEKIRPSILENIRNQKSNVSTGLANLNFNANRSNTALNSIPEKERTLVEITRRKTIKNDLYSYLQQKREEAALSLAPTNGDSRIVDVAEASTEPVKPKRLLAYLAGFVLACAFGIAYVLSKENLSKNIMFRKEIEEHASFSIIAELPYLNKAENKIFLEPWETMALEQFRHLCAKLGLYNKAVDKKCILVTSSIAGEGKSFVSANLAHSLSMSGQKVVLIDMDFRKPQLSQRFKLNDSKGVLDFLVNAIDYKDIVNALTEKDNLFVIPAGTKGGYHSKWLLKGNLAKLFEQLTKDFDYIIVDSAPIDLVSEVNILGEFCDKTLLVVRHAYTPKHIVKRLRTSTKLEFLKDVAIVFNGVKKRGMTKEINDFGYGYGYDLVEYH
ncbi:capsular exopolysaccharide synthesis family protein [Arenibacter algicola]|uniref:non-specific protein-tyrosine kinase n=1 Tax=Arenibacter algicola TaxID=616991 RepID=A0ABY3AD23_9FLAO